jgi:hypothetical protein
MYPPVHDLEKQAGDQHHPAPFPASGHPNTSHSPQPYASAPPYIATGVRAHAVPGRWSTGLCHCCDDPANCKDLPSSLISSHKLSSDLVTIRPRSKSRTNEISNEPFWVLVQSLVRTS